MKIIFLDFDGVLNNMLYIGDPSKDYLNNPCDPQKVSMLDSLVSKTGAYVVISSSWRLFWSRTKCAEVLKNCGFNGLVVDRTPTSVPAGDARGHEIQYWLDNVPKPLVRRFGEVTHFVILDDDADMAHLTPKLVQTDIGDGLTWDKVEEAYKHLS